MNFIWRSLGIPWVVLACNPERTFEMDTRNGADAGEGVDETSRADGSIQEGSGGAADRTASSGNGSGGNGNEDVDASPGASGSGGTDPGGNEGGSDGGGEEACECEEGDSCSAGECYSWVCDPNEDFCSEGAVRRCAGDGLSSEQVELCGEDQYCEVASAQCEDGACAPDQPTCVGNSIRYCNDEGTGYESGGIPCEAGMVCFGEGQCGECLPSATRSCGSCSDGIETCTNSGVWGGCRDAGSEYRCTPEAPNGWSGPVAFWKGPGSPPECTGAYPTLALTGGADLQAAAAACSSCSCGAPYSCSIWLSTFYTANGCSSSGSSWSLSVAETSTCHVPGFAVTTRVGGTQRSPGSDLATPSGGVMTEPEPSFRESGQLCSTSAPSACDSGEGVCAPHASGEYASSPLCIYRVGSHSCPSSFPNQQVLYDGYDDRRTCSACTCSGTCGTVTERVYATDDCTGSYESEVMPNTGSSGNCTSAYSGSSYYYTLSGSTFSASSTTPSGDVTGTDPTTVCCLE